MTSSGPSGGDEFVTLLAASRASVVQLLDKHEPGSDGRCRVCSAGPQGGKVFWPCRIWSIASEARRLQQDNDDIRSAGCTLPVASP